MLEVDGLAKRYGDVLALKDLTVRVDEGECLVLLGRNGAGKTTALRCMAGVLGPTAGTVKVDGIDAADDPAAVRARVGLMPEVPGLYERGFSDDDVDRSRKAWTTSTGNHPPCPVCIRKDKIGRINVYLEAGTVACAFCGTAFGLADA